MHDSIDKFDREIKAILESGEEAVPPRVWHAIASQLPAAKPAVPVWGWLGMSLAAAALALGVVFSGIFDRKALVDEGAALALQEQVVSEAEAESEGVTVSEPSLRPGDGGHVRASRSSHRPLDGPPAYEPRVATQSAATGSSGTEASDAAAQQAANPKKEAGSVDETGKTGGEQVADKKTEPDPFVLLAFEDSRHKSSRSTSIVATGLLGSNDGSAKSIHSTKVFSSGAYTPKKSSGISESSESVFSVPVSVGLGVKIGLSDRLSLGTGLTYSLLERSFSGTYVKDGVTMAANADVRHSMQYVGIPLNVYLEIWNGFDFHMYTFAGGQIEKGISNKYYISHSPEDIILSPKVEGLQYSVALGAGTQYDVTQHLSLYLDPSLRYYFDSGQPKSIRTKKPLMFTFEAGVRFKL